MLTRTPTLYLLTAALIGASGALSAGCSDDAGPIALPDAGMPDATQPDAEPPADAEPQPDAMPPPQRGIISIAGGPFTEYEGLGGIDFFGGAQLIRTESSTRVQFYLEHGGVLTDGEDYVARVHSLPCDVERAGDPYRVDPSATLGDQDNEMWVPFSPAVGFAEMSVEFDAHTARADAQSFLIRDNDAAETPLMCVDFDFDDSPTSAVELTGSFAPFADKEAIDDNIAGSVTVIVDGLRTDIDYRVSGLDPSESYEAHVHAFPCDIANGGGHYQRDVTRADVNEQNELWLFKDFTPTDTAAQEATVGFPAHAMRDDGLSVVIHRNQDDGAQPKVACADITRATPYPSFTLTGTATELDDLDAKYDNLSASASLVRNIDGTTDAELTVLGLPVGLTEVIYPAYVHDSTCNTVPPGRGRYVREPGQGVDEEFNELWLLLTEEESGDGAATATVTAEDHTAGARATSVVIFDPDDTSLRIACVDLQ